MFVLGGPKNYVFFVFCPLIGKRTTKCKVKGIIFNYEHPKVVNVEGKDFETPPR